MSLRNLPEAKSFTRPQNFQWDAPSDVLSQWADKPLAAVEGDNVITIYDVIGEDYWSGTGVTVKRVAAALRTIGDRDVIARVNSPGGDMFEGIAIYNQLRAHKGKVTVEVMGWAASAASIIAMAGDEIVMGLGTFIMIHNAWGAVVGNRHDFSAASELFDGFDAAMADIYEARTGAKRKIITDLMDAESFMGPTEAVKNGFADRVSDDLAAPAADGDKFKAMNAKNRLDAALARQGLPRSERRRMLKEATGTHDAADDDDATHDAGFIAAARQLINQMKS